MIVCFDLVRDVSERVVFPSSQSHQGTASDTGAFFETYAPHVPKARRLCILGDSTMSPGRPRNVMVQKETLCPRPHPRTAPAGFQRSDLTTQPHTPPRRQAVSRPWPSAGLDGGMCRGPGHELLAPQRVPALWAALGWKEKALRGVMEPETWQCPATCGREASRRGRTRAAGAPPSEGAKHRRRPRSGAGQASLGAVGQRKAPTKAHGTFEELKVGQARQGGREQGARGAR